MRKDTNPFLWVWLVLLAVGLYLMTAFAVFQFRHPKANDTTFWTYFPEWFTFSTVKDLQ